MRHLSNYSIFSVPEGHAVAAYVFFIVFPPLYTCLYPSFSNVIPKAVPTQDVTNPVSLSSYNTKLRPNLTLQTSLQQHVDPSGRAVQGVGQLPLACWDCEFASSREHGCLSLVSVVRCQVEITRGAYHSTRVVLLSMVCLSVIAKRSKEGRPTPGIGSKHHRKKNYSSTVLIVYLYGNLQTRLLPRTSPSDQNNASRPRPTSIVRRSLLCALDRTCL